MTNGPFHLTEHARNLHQNLFNSIPNHKIFNWSKLKALADGKINGIEKIRFVF